MEAVITWALATTTTTGDCIDCWNHPGVSGTGACMDALQTPSVNLASASAAQASPRPWSYIPLYPSDIFSTFPFSKFPTFILNPWFCFQGGCYPGNQRPPPRASDFQPFQDCTSTPTCLTVDMNLICNTNLTTGNQGKCQCRTNMRWNTEAGECQVDFQRRCSDGLMFYPQIYMDVDCSDITYDTPPSPTILEAVEKAKLRLNATEGSDLYSTLLSPILMKYII